MGIFDHNDSFLFFVSLIMKQISFIIVFLVKTCIDFHRGWVRVSQATTIMISSLLKDSSGGFEAVSVRMIAKIIYEIQILLQSSNSKGISKQDRYSCGRSESSYHYHEGEGG